MSFAYSIFIFIGFIAALILAGFYIVVFISRNRAIENFADKKLLNEIISGLDNRKRKAKAILIVVAVFLLFLALARPQWGFEWKEIKNRGVDIIFAIDTSKSMLAEDIKPNRLKRVKLEVEYILKNLMGDRIGIVAFSGNSFLQCPLTVDYDGFLISLRDLNTQTIPREGTSIASAINECIDTYKRNSRKNKIAVLITDGEDHEGKVIEAAKNAQKDNIKIFCIGIGTEKGSVIPLLDKDGKLTYLKDVSGNIVTTKFDDTLLKKVAFITGGSYFHATESDFGLQQLYEERLLKIKEQAQEEKREKKPRERFQLFIILALIILVIEPFISEKKNVSK